MKRFIQYYTITTLMIIVISLIALLFMVIFGELPQLATLFNQAVGITVNSEINVYYNWAKVLSIFIIGNVLVSAIFTILINKKERLSEK